jgi:hypothetical protein
VFDDHTGVSFINTNTSETTSAVTSTTSSYNDVLEYAVTWITDPTVGDIIVWSYDGIGNYRDTDGTLLPSDSVQLDSCNSLFITTWVANSTRAMNIQLPLVSGANYDFTVDWGDGDIDTITSWDQAEKVHVYSSAGTYNVMIKGLCEQWNFNTDPTGKDSIIDIVQWGDTGFTSYENMFRSCVNIGCSATDAPNLTAVTSIASMFRGCQSFNSDI